MLFFATRQERFRVSGKERCRMQHSRAQIQLQYHQTLNRICEMELLAEQMTKLADSYRKEEQRKKPVLREKEEPYESAAGRESPGTALLAQAKELKSAAQSWFQQAREEYHSSLQEIRQEEERAGKW